jgi:hypothetical protein
VRGGGRPTALALGLYAAAFALLVLSAGFLAWAVLDELRGMGRLWVSSALSVLAGALALAAVLLPGREEP